MASESYLVSPRIATDSKLRQGSNTIPSGWLGFKQGTTFTIIANQEQSQQQHTTTINNYRDQNQTIPDQNGNRILGRTSFVAVIYIYICNDHTLRVDTSTPLDHRGSHGGLRIQSQTTRSPLLSIGCIRNILIRIINEYE